MLDYRSIAFLLIDRHAIYAVPNSWGKKGCTHIHPDALNEQALNELLLSALNQRVTKGNEVKSKMEELEVSAGDECAHHSGGDLCACYDQLWLWAFFYFLMDALVACSRMHGGFKHSFCWTPRAAMAGEI